MDELFMYICRSSERKVTNKVALNGYAYTKRGGKGGVSYWYCDQRKICSASLIEKSGTFSTKVDCKLSNATNRGWGPNGTHEAHPPDYERIKREISTRTRRLEKRKKAQEKRAREKCGYGQSEIENIKNSSVQVEEPVSTLIENSNENIEESERNDDLNREDVWAREGELLRDDSNLITTPEFCDNELDAAVTPVLIDTDGGFYDAWAVGLAFTSTPNIAEKKFKIVGITTVNGCTTVTNAVQNMGRVLHAIGGNAKHTPVFKGMDSSLLGTRDSTPRPAFFGKDGFGGALSPVPLEKDLKVASEHGVNAIIKLAEQYKGKLTILALGPLTNLAMAVKLRPEIRNYVKEIYILGGNSEGVGNVTVCGEFNFYADPEAAHVVLQNFTACPVYLMPWETCMRSAASSYTFRTQTLGALNTSLMSLLNKIESKNLTNPGESWVAPDAVVVACFMNHKVMRKTQHYHCTVELQGKHTRGMTIVDKNFLNQKPGNVFLITDIDRSVYETMLVDALGHTDNHVQPRADAALKLDQNYF